MGLVTRLQPAKNTYGVLGGGLVDRDLLETTFQCLVFFDVLSVFVDRGSADASKLSTSESWLQQVGRVHRTLGGTCSNDGVHLVDENDDFSVAVLNFLQNGLETLFELSTHAGSGHQCRQVESNQFASLQSIGDVARNHALGDALGNRGLSDTGITNQDGVVLGTATQDLDGTADFIVTADDGIELAVFRFFGKVDTVFQKGVVVVFGRPRNNRSGLFSKLDDRVGNVRVFYVLLQECLRGEPVVLLGKSKQECLCGNKGVAQRRHGASGGFQDLGKAVSHGFLLGRRVSLHFWLLGEVCLQFLSEGLHVALDILQNLLDGLSSGFGVVARFVFGRIEQEVQEDGTLYRRRLVEIGGLGESGNGGPSRFGILLLVEVVRGHSQGCGG
mmetsp:Transcript_13434/g.31042  ORF Transcript_13434/g.31042 Transcript_13434/m.31042 type:complete len:387 (-) Transcript_13434:79-1239(-)